AASVLAVRLLALGLRVRLLGCGHPPYEAVEAIPARISPLFTELGLSSVLDRAGAVVVHGFENLLSPGSLTTSRSDYIHVQRRRLAAEVLDAAEAMGASVQKVARLPDLLRDADRHSISVGQDKYDFDFVVDATGRSARWSR